MTDKKLDKEIRKRFAKLTGVSGDSHYIGLFLALNDMNQAGISNWGIATAIMAGHQFFKAGVGISYIDAGAIINNFMDLVDTDEGREFIEWLDEIGYENGTIDFAKNFV